MNLGRSPKEESRTPRNRFGWNPQENPTTDQSQRYKDITQNLKNSGFNPRVEQQRTREIYQYEVSDNYQEVPFDYVERDVGAGPNENLREFSRVAQPFAEDVIRPPRDNNNARRDGEDPATSETQLSYLLQHYPHVLQNRRIADLLVDPASGITPGVILESILRRQTKNGPSDSGGGTMATTAKHGGSTGRDKFDAGEEDIAAIAKQISDHAEAIYQTWKSRGLAPTEILNCHTPQAAVDKFGSALAPQKSSSAGATPVSELLARAPDMDNNNLEKLVNSFVNEDKARIAAQKSRSPTKSIPTSIQFALQKFEKNASPQKVATPSPTKTTPVKVTTPIQSPPAYSPKPAIGVKPQVVPKNFNLIQHSCMDGDTIEMTFPPDLVPIQKPEAPKRPAGLSLQSPPNLQTWPLKNKVVENKLQKSEPISKNDRMKGSPKFSTLPGGSAAYVDEVAREEERLINALKTGVVLSEEPDTKSFSAARSKKESSPSRSVKPDLIPSEKFKHEPSLSTAEYSKTKYKENTEKIQKDEPNISLVDYAKTKYKDHLENPPTQQRLDANKRMDIDRKCLMVDPTLGLQVTETRSKFEGSLSHVDKANDKEVGMATAMPSGRWGTPRAAGSRIRSELVPHPELTSQQRQHISRAQADRAAAAGGSPIRPFLTRGSVAERVLIFEKCPPTDVLLDKRKAPAVAAWRTGHDVIAKAQTYGSGRCVSAPSSTCAPGTLQRAVRAQAASGGFGASRAPVPKFHFPRGRPPPQSSADQAVQRVQSAFNTFPNSQVPRESFHHIVKACDCPLYWKAPIFLASQRSLTSPVDGHKFIDFWRQMIAQCHDQASRFVYILTRGTSTTLGPEDLSPLIQDVVDTHPGLSFLKEATEFHSRYVHTVIARIFYCVNRSWSGRISVPELRRSDLLQVLQLLEEEEDINQVTAYFSYEHFYVIYCKFWELDRDHDLFIDKQDLARHNDHALSSRMIERVVSGCVTKGGRIGRRGQRPEGEEPRMSYSEFVWFLLAEEDKQHPTAIEYWFRCMDLDGDGFLSMYELEYFYEEQMHRMEAIGIETLPFQDCLCQMLDMVQPVHGDKIMLSDLKRCKMTPIFFDTFFNLEKYLDHEQRDPFASQRDHDADGHELSEWDRFAAEEYELLVAEEGGSDAQDQASYDETDDDCLSPNLDEILSTEIVEDSSISPMVLHLTRQIEKSPVYSPKSPENLSTGFVRLTSIYNSPTLEKAVLTKAGEQYLKNGFLDRQLAANRQSPISLTSLSKMENDHSPNNGNASFLYSQLLSPSRNKPFGPSPTTSAESGQDSIIYANLINEPSQPNTTLSGSTLNRLSFTSGINKISDNYEKAVAGGHTAPRDTGVNRLFKKDNGASPVRRGKSPQFKNEDDDEDYARDSDECSI